MIVGTFQPHCILILGPDSFSRKPKSFIHRFKNGLSLLSIRFRILTDDCCNTGSESVAPIVIGRGMGHCPTIIIERITGPDTTIGIIQMVTIRIIVPLLPCQMRLDDRPHLAHISRIGIILEMPKQFIDIIQIHIVVMHLIVTLRITANIPIGIHLRTPFLLGTCQIHLGVLRRMGNYRFYVRHLTLGIGIEM